MYQRSSASSLPLAMSSTIRSVVSSVGSAASKGSSFCSTTYLNGYTPGAWYRFSLRTIVLTLLPLLSLLGTYCTMSLASRNGTFDTILSLLVDNDPKFPGTDELLLLRYTGLKGIDKQLTILVAFFAPVVDLRNTNLNLFGIYGLGQFGAVWTLMVMESMRMGNKRRAVSFTSIVGLIMQNITYAITTPIWLFIHIITSPVAKPFPGTHANTVLLIPSLDLCLLPLSITISSLIPSLLIGLPPTSLNRPETHQHLLALWQIFPLLTILTHSILRAIANKLCSYLFPMNPSARPPIPQGASYLNNAKHVYRFVFTLCIGTHLPVLLLSLFPSSLLPEFLPSPDQEVPSAFRILLSSTFASVFVPSSPFSSAIVNSTSTFTSSSPEFTKGVQTFLQYDIYIGSLGFILWAILLYRNAETEKAIVDPNSSLPIYRELLAGEKRRVGEGEWKRLGWRMLGWALLAGPVGVVAGLMWGRDRVVRMKIKQGI